MCLDLRMFRFLYWKTGLKYCGRDSYFIFLQCMQHLTPWLQDFLLWFKPKQKQHIIDVKIDSKCIYSQIPAFSFAFKPVTATKSTQKCQVCHQRSPETQTDTCTSVWNKRDARVVNMIHSAEDHMHNSRNYSWAMYWYPGALTRKDMLPLCHTFRMKEKCCFQRLLQTHKTSLILILKPFTIIWITGARQVHGFMSYIYHPAAQKQS